MIAASRCCGECLQSRRMRRNAARHGREARRRAERLQNMQPGRQRRFGTSRKQSNPWEAKAPHLTSGGRPSPTLRGVPAELASIPMQQLDDVEAPSAHRLHFLQPSCQSLSLAAPVVQIACAYGAEKACAQGSNVDAREVNTAARLHCVRRLGQHGVGFAL